MYHLTIVNCIFKVELVRTEQANTDFSIFCELLKDYIGLIGAVKVNKKICRTHFYNLILLFWFFLECVS